MLNPMHAPIEERFVTPVTQDEKQHHFYPTPKPLAAAALRVLPFGFVPSRILDPGSGTGVWGEAATELWSDAVVHGVELRDVTPNPAYRLWVQGDFLDREVQKQLASYGQYDLVTGNPPFKFGEEFVKAAMRLTRPEGHVTFLLPVAFLGTQERGSWLWDSLPPYKVHMILKRPSFKDGRDRKTGKVRKGATDPGKEYVIIDWINGYSGPTYMSRLSW